MATDLEMVLRVSNVSTEVKPENQVSNAGENEESYQAVRLSSCSSNLYYDMPYLETQDIQAAILIRDTPNFNMVNFVPIGRHTDNCDA